MTHDLPDFLDGPVDDAARQLIGCVLERELDGHTVYVRIVETESYDQDDEASHAFGGERKRNATMFKSAGHLYVYFTYGMHYCCNIVTGPAGYGSGVLIRAVEPILNKNNGEVLGILGKNRGGKTGPVLTNGPGKLAQALHITMDLNGHDLHTLPLRLISGKLEPNETVVTSPRIGISRAREIHRRYYIAGNAFVSHQ
jgi:DNA-3-methyladenine glycosylase